jgi:hypothetical protein
MFARDVRRRASDEGYYAGRNRRTEEVLRVCDELNEARKALGAIYKRAESEPKDPTWALGRIAGIAYAVLNEKGRTGDDPR